MEDKAIPVEARILRLWRDTLEAENWSIENEGEGHIADRSWGGVSLLDRVVASIEGYLIEHDADWPKEDWEE